MDKGLYREQEIQEEQYNFPYHYIPSCDDGNFSQVMYWSWGYQYLSAMQFILNKLGELRFESLVDIGCGDGRFLREVRRVYPNKKLLGIDYSQRAIAMASALNRDITWLTADITKERLEELFDVATLIEVLEHIPPQDIKSFVDGVRESLDRGGYLMLTVPSKNKGVSEKHFQHFDSTSLKQLLEPSFSVLEVHYIHHPSRNFSRLFNLLYNDYWKITWPRLMNWFYGVYLRRYFLTSSEKGARVCLIAQRK